MSSIKKNFIYNFGYQILLIILPLVTTPYVSRVLGSEGIGVYSYTFSTAFYFMIFAKLGIDNYGNRSVAQNRNDKNNLSKVFCSIYGMQIITVVIVLTIYSIYTIYWIGYSKIALVQGIYILSTLFDINWLFFGLEEFKLTVTRNAIIKVLTIICVFVFVKSKDDLLLYIFIMSVGVIASQIVLWFFVKKHVYFLIPTINDIKVHLKPNIMLFYPIFVVSIYKMLNKLMLGNISGMSELGIYENAEKIINLPLSAIAALGTVMLPRMSSLANMGDVQTERNMIEKSMIFIILLSSAFMFGIASIAPEFAPIFFGSEFSKTGTLISALSIIIIFIAWANVIRTQYVIPYGKENIYLMTSIFGAITNFIIILILIPPLGAKGAVIGTIIAEIVVSVSQTYFVKDDLAIKDFIKNSFVFIVFGFVMLISVRLVAVYLPLSIFSLFIEILVGALVYSLLIIIYISNSKNEIIVSLVKPFKNKYLRKVTKIVTERTSK